MSAKLETAGEFAGESEGFWSVHILSKFSTLWLSFKSGLKGDSTCSTDLQDCQGLLQHKLVLAWDAQQPQA